LIEPGSENLAMITLPGAGALQLLLACSDDHQPALADGLSDDAARAAKKPKKDRSRDVHDWDGPGKDPNDLAAQRWGVVVPGGPDGKELLDAVAPLLCLREQEQGAPVKIYRVAPDMDAVSASQFRDDVYRAEDVPDHERPRYLLILGDLDRISLDLQQVLASSALVGRLAFSSPMGEVDLDAYRAYASKVVRWAERPSAEEMPDARFFTAQDGTPATSMASAALVRPSLAEAEQLRGSGKLLAASVSEPGSSLDDLLRAAAGSRPAVLLSVSHGLGAPRGGWKGRSVERQRSLQGALAGGGRDMLSAAELAGKRFLPGGMWFCLACFGAGTPAGSVYYPWLSALAKEGAYQGRLDSVLKSLPSAGQSPFIAALPQAALASPEGPLAVLGHADLAWTYAFASVKNPALSYWRRIFSVIAELVDGSRAGVALDALMRFYRDATTDLHHRYQDQSDARAWNRPDPTDPTELAHLWMLSHDLRGYILLGDPAARLPLKRHAPPPEAAPAPRETGAVSRPEAAAPTSAAAPPSAPNERRDAVLAVLRGESRTEIAAWCGITMAELKRWVNAFVNAGSDALASLDGS
jgi:Helix-turn-helix domain